MATDDCPELEKYRLKNGDLVPETIYYVPDFITPAEEQELIRQVLAAPKPKWTYLGNRSLQNWGGLPHPKGMVPEALPTWLKIYTEKLGAMNLFGGVAANHILMNRYMPGQGIMAHEDGPLFYPTVTTINTGSHTVLNFYRKPESAQQPDRQCAFSLLLWPRSLLVLRHEAYTDYLHEIEELKSDEITTAPGPPTEQQKYFANLHRIPEVQKQIEEGSGDSGDPLHLERDTRYSFTIRYVPKVLKKLNLQKLLFK